MSEKAYPLCETCVVAVVDFPTVIVGQTDEPGACSWCGYETTAPRTLVRPVKPLVLHGDAA